MGEGTGGAEGNVRGRHPDSKALTAIDTVVRTHQKFGDEGDQSSRRSGRSENLKTGSQDHPKINCKKTPDEEGEQKGTDNRTTFGNWGEG